MLRVIENKEYKAPKHYNDIGDEMSNIVWGWGSNSLLKKGFSRSQLKKLRDNYRYREFQTLRFRGLSNEAKKIVAELKQLNKEYREARFKYYNPNAELNLTIIHSESKSMRILRANMVNYGKRQAQIKKQHRRNNRRAR